MRERREVTVRLPHLRQRPRRRPRVRQSGSAQTVVCVAQVRDGTRRCLGACRHRSIRRPGEVRCAGGPAHAGFASALRACARSVPHRRERAAAGRASLRTASSASSSRATSRSIRSIVVRGGVSPVAGCAVFASAAFSVSPPPASVASGGEGSGVGGTSSGGGWRFSARQQPRRRPQRLHRRR